MAKTELTKKLEEAIMAETYKSMGAFGCLEVTIGYFGKGRVDYMTMDSKDIFRCYEIKISKSDFHSKHGHNFVGHYNYYVMPQELYEEVKEEIKNYIGVYVGYECEYKGEKYWKVSLIKKARKQKLKVSIDILKNSMIRSLYRDAFKIRQCENIKVMNNLKNKISKLEKQNADYKKKFYNYKNAIYEELGHNEYKKFIDKYNL